MKKLFKILMVIVIGLMSCNKYKYECKYSNTYFNNQEISQNENDYNSGKISYERYLFKLNEYKPKTYITYKNFATKREIDYEIAKHNYMTTEKVETCECY
jgi:hypothetical protein